MSDPMTAAKFLAALKAEGVDVVEVAGWRTRNRNHKGDWGPVHGVMIHHTAGGSSGAVEYCRDGSSALPGPLCHGVITKDGKVHLIGMGRTNHAGGGDPQVLAAVKSEDYGDRPPKSDEHEGTDGAVDGNAHFYGFECVNRGDGKDPWPDVQVEAIERVSAAICRAHGWTAKSVIGHLEWSDWKSDPKGVPMPGLRDRVQARLGGAPSVPTPPAPQPPAGLPTVSLSHAIAAARRDPGLPQGGATHRAEVRLIEAALVKLGYLGSQWAADGSFGTKTVDAYRKVQWHLGYTGSDADGIPGNHSLTWLGQKSGLFRKVA